MSKRCSWLCQDVNPVFTTPDLRLDYKFAAPANASWQAAWGRQEDVGGAPPAGIYSSTGNGLISSPANPAVSPVPLDFRNYGIGLYILDCSTLDHYHSHDCICYYADVPKLTKYSRLQVGIPNPLLLDNKVYRKVCFTQNASVLTNPKGRLFS